LLLLLLFAILKMLLLLLLLQQPGQADTGALLDAVGRLCSCRAGPAGAVSGYLAHGTSMDWCVCVLRMFFKNVLKCVWFWDLHFLVYS
jgi:hypothetical protein